MFWGINYVLYRNQAIFSLLNHISVAELHSLSFGFKMIFLRFSSTDKNIIFKINPCTETLVSFSFKLILSSFCNSVDFQFIRGCHYFFFFLINLIGCQLEKGECKVTPTEILIEFLHVFYCLSA